MNPRSPIRITEPNWFETTTINSLKLLQILFMEEEKYSTIDIREIALKCTTKGEVYKVLTTTGGVYLPSVQHTNWDFISDIISGDKLVIN